MNKQEIKGLHTFIEEGCIICHTGTLLGGKYIHRYPLNGTHKDLTGSIVDDPGKMQGIL